MKGLKKRKAKGAEPKLSKKEMKKLVELIEKTDNILELSLMHKLKGRIKYRLEDFKNLRGIAYSCIVFGSYISPKEQPSDLDIFFVINKNNFEGYKRALNDIKNIVPIKIHDVLQTEDDFKKNILTLTPQKFREYV